jgi:homoserine kinase
MPAAISVRVPATVANLGPGFDAFGIAIRMYLEVELEPRRDTIDVSLDGEGSGELPADETNLVIRSMDAFFTHIARRPSGFAVTIKNPIPLASGLGSSAAAVVGGLMAARALAGSKVHQTELISLATEIEGHPDNVLPALLGGLVVCYRNQKSGELDHYQLEPSERLVPIIVVPRKGFPTTKAREALPGDVSFADAQFTASRAGLLVGAMTAGAGSDVLAEAMNDRLHEPHRMKLMPETAAVLTELRDAGLPAAMAGAGPSILAVVPKPEAATRTEQIRRVCRNRSEGWRVFVSEWEPEGAQARA